ncbi:Rho GTPase-activating protein 1 [Hibiscus syriacus]|uniref:Rho GTPase-activating protein 1 n=1 Tax=Hibiscus syriacus TaxID=106335 RepID=A0A6A2WWJ8_HIBSY|nr:Rho GTPase-activating protein 1 [Hibiscus syriacus]
MIVASYHPNLCFNPTLYRRQRKPFFLFLGSKFVDPNKGWEKSIMTEVLQSSPSHFPSFSSSNVSTVGNIIAQGSDQEEEENRQEGERKEREREGDQLSLLTLFLAAFRKSLIGCSLSGSKEICSMEIGLPTNFRHVAHVTFDSASVFGVSTESMQLSPDSRGNSVPTILLLMQNVHCLAGLIKAWFRELPSGVLDSLPPEEVMEAQSEEECARLVRLLPPTEAALLDWAINLMADVVQVEHLNKMNARNVAMVFAPNMTQMSDPLTALMHAVQVMNLLKTLIIRTLKEREDSMIDSNPDSRSEPSDKNGQQSFSQLLEDANEEVKNESEGEKAFVAEEPSVESPPHSAKENLTTESSSQGFLTTIDNTCGGNRSTLDKCSCTLVSQVNSLANGLEKGGIGKNRVDQSSASSRKKGTKKGNEESMENAGGGARKNKGTRIAGLINMRAELFEAWR